MNNIPSPYSVDLFRTLQKNYPEIDFHVIFTNASEGNRNWKGDVSSLANVTVLKSKVIRLKTGNDQRYIHFPGNIAKELERISPAAVFAKEYNPSALSSLAWCRRNKRKYIHVTEGTLLTEQHLNPVQLLARRWIISSSDYCIASGSKAKEKLRYWKCPEERIAVSYLTFDHTALKAIKRQPCPGRILYVGSLAVRKGVDLLLQSLPYLKEDWNLHIVGSGSEKERSDLMETAKRLSISDRITWCGYLEGDALYRQYAEASVFALATREDCFGLVLLEAAFKGVPIVSSIYADGAYDIIEQGKTGLLADPYHPREFADAIAGILRSPEYEKNAACADLSRFEIENTAAVYPRVLAEIHAFA